MFLPFVDSIRLFLFLLFYCGYRLELKRAIASEGGDERTVFLLTGHVCFGGEVCHFLD